MKKIFIKEETTSQLKDITPAISKPKNTNEVQYTKDEVLNKVLNETKSGLSSQDNEEYQTLGGSSFDSTSMSELMGYGKPEEVKRDMVAVDTMKKAGVSVDQVPESLVNALTRDYSDLMKHDKMKSKR